MFRCSHKHVWYLQVDDLRGTREGALLQLREVGFDYPFSGTREASPGASGGVPDPTTYDAPGCGENEAPGCLGDEAPGCREDDAPGCGADSTGPGSRDGHGKGVPMTEAVAMNGPSALEPPHEPLLPREQGSNDTLSPPLPPPPLPSISPMGSVGAQPEPPVPNGGRRLQASEARGPASTSWSNDVAASSVNSVNISSRMLLSGVDLGLDLKSRIGLVGPNGRCGGMCEMVNSDVLVFIASKKSFKA